jgi:hypothetical protein
MTVTASHKKTEVNTRENYGVYALLSRITGLTEMLHEERYLALFTIIFNHMAGNKPFLLRHRTIFQPFLEV